MVNSSTEFVTIRKLPDASAACFYVPLFKKGLGSACIGAKLE